VFQNTEPTQAEIREKARERFQKHQEKKRPLAHGHDGPTQADNSDAGAYRARLPKRRMISSPIGHCRLRSVQRAAVMEKFLGPQDNVPTAC